MKKTLLNSALSLMLTTLTLSSPLTVYAQDAADTLEEIVVTGSRIPMNANLESASPVTTVGADEFLYTGITRVEDLLNDLPQVTGSNVANDSNGATGTATVDLRDLGPQRTLVLINGRRLANGTAKEDGEGADLNFIPSALVKRVEVLTGGASATYGSDAIAGVVNFQLDDKFDGLRIDVQGSIYQHKNDNGEIQSLVNAKGFDLPDSNVFDGESYTASVVWGKNFANDRGNVTAYLNYRDTQAVTHSERDYSACALNGSRSKGDLVCGGSTTIAEGRFTDFTDFDFKVSGDKFVPRAGTLYNYAPNNYFQRPDERVVTGLNGHFDFSDSLTGYFELGYMKNETLAQIAPSGAFFVTDSLNCGNPLLSAQQRQALCGDYGLGDGDSQSVFIGRRNVEGGFRAEDLQHEQSRIVLGMKGDINDNWSFDASLNYGKVELNSVYLNDLSKTKITRALDVVSDSSGNAVCRSALNGVDPSCVPWNIFQTGGVTQAQTDYLVADLNATGETSLTNVVAFVTGDLTDYGMILPGASSGVSVVAGYEYRKDELSIFPNIGFTSNDGAGQGSATPVVDASLAVNELFLEANVPLFTDRVNLGLGYRHSDYDTDQKTDTYKVTLDGRVVPDILKLRASYQAATRHANIRELFSPQKISLFDGGNDPCAGKSPEASFAQCARSGVTAAQYGNIAANSAGQYNELSGGNPDLDPEDSETQSIGFVFTPADGLDIAVDWFNIDVTGAIDGAGAQFVINQCIEANQFCDRINRDAVRGTLWIGADNVVNTDSNIGFEEREGIDVSLNYSFDIGGAGSMKFAYNAAFVTKNDRQAVEGSKTLDCNGKWGGDCEEPNAKYRHNARLSWYTNSDIVASMAWRHTGGVEEETSSAYRDDFGSANYLDLAATWNANDNLALRFGVNNILDRSPATSGKASNGNVEVSTYDPLGRYIFFGATYDL